MNEQEKEEESVSAVFDTLSSCMYCLNDVLSECHAHLESDAPFVGVGVVEVSESADIVDFY